MSMNSPLKLNKSIVASWNAAFVLALVTLHLLLVGRAEAQGHFFHGGTTYRYRSVTRSGPGVNLLPGTMMLSSVSSAPIMGQPLALTPGIAVHSLSLSPSTLSLGPQNFYLHNGTTSGVSLSLAPQASYQLVHGTNSGATLSLVPQQVNGAKTVSLSGGFPTADHGLQVLSLGFGNDQTKVNAFLQTLKNKLEGLVGAVGKNLDKQDVEDLLLATAKAALAGSGFGFVVDPVLEIFLKPVIDKLIGDRLPDGTGTTGTGTTGTGTLGPGNAGTTTPTPRTPPPAVPSGGMSFTVSGTIILTPASGGAQNATRPSGIATPVALDLKIDNGGSASPVVDGP